jgi:hypothetical protein
MSGWMPVLGQHHVAEPRCKPIDDRHDLIAARHGERAARTKIVLYVHDDEDVVAVDGRVLAHGRRYEVAICRSRRRSTSAASSLRSSATSTP